MTNQPDPAAVRCLHKLDSSSSSAFAQIVERECAIPQGRALAEAVLATFRSGSDIYICKLARAYLDALNGTNTNPKKEEPKDG